MEAVIVKARSNLVGERCALCPRVVRVGESVLRQRLAGTYGQDRFVAHTDCMAALVDRAPVGRPPGDPVARLAALRRRIQATGRRFPDHDVDAGRSARELHDLLAAR